MVLKKLYVVLKVTKACDLDCAYCYESKTEKKFMSEPLLMKCLNEITSISEDATIILHGGEPTLINKSLLIKFLEKAEAKIKEGKQISFNIQTNGMQIDSEWIEIFKKYNITVGFSIDGPQELHDKYRLTRNGKGSHKTVLNNITTAGMAGIEKNCLCVITKDSLENICNLFDFFNDLDIQGIDFLPCMVENDNQKITKTDLTISPEDYAEFIIKYYNLRKENNSNYDVRSFSDFIDILNGRDSRTCNLIYPKICGWEVVSVDTDGYVYPCDSFAGIEDMRIGNIAEDGLEKILKSEKAKNFYEVANTIPKECESCGYLKYCFGGCVYHRYYNSKNPEEKTYYCEAYKKIFKYLKTQINSNANSVSGRL